MTHETNDFEKDSTSWKYAEGGNWVERAIQLRALSLGNASRLPLRKDPNREGRRVAEWLVRAFVDIAHADPVVRSPSSLPWVGRRGLSIAERAEAGEGGPASVDSPVVEDCGGRDYSDDGRIMEGKFATWLDEAGALPVRRRESRTRAGPIIFVIEDEASTAGLPRVPGRMLPLA